MKPLRLLILLATAIILSSCETIKEATHYQDKLTPEQVEAEKARRAEYANYREKSERLNNNQPSPDGSFDKQADVCKKEMDLNTPRGDLRKCDLVTYQFFMDKDEFMQKCLPKKKKEVCQKMYLDSFAAKLELDYPNANWNEVSKRCQAEPLDCDQSTMEGLVYFEKLAYRSQLAHEREENARIEQEQRQRIGLALKAFSDGMARNAQQQQMIQQIKQTSCTSQQIGNTIQTNCH